MPIDTGTPSRVSPRTTPSNGNEKAVPARVSTEFARLPGEGAERLKAGVALLTFASNALAASEAPWWVPAMLGHASPEMLFSVYARFIPNRTRRAVPS